MSDELLREGETVEFKENWSERVLDDIAALANHRGGSVWIGVRDDGAAVGFEVGDAKLQGIANQIVDVLGVRPSLNRRRYDDRPVLVIEVSPAPGLVACKGRYFTRVGSTNRDLSPDQMTEVVLARSGLTWDGLPSRARLDAVDPAIVRRYLRLARARLPEAREDDPPERVLANLQLLSEEHLTNAGLLLFTPRPQSTFPAAQVRIGRFKSGQIIDDRTIAGSLIDQVEGGINALRSSLQVRYEFPGEGTGIEALQRREVWDYPLSALREALVNALIHRDYTVTGDIQIRVYDDELDFWNPGGLPAGVSLSDLRQERHHSRPRNPLLAQVFHAAGFIERWGTGTTRMILACRDAGLPEPEFSESMGGFRVVFRKSWYDDARLLELGLNDRQVKAVSYAARRGSITNREYRAISGLKERMARQELTDLVARGILVRQGTTGRGARYLLVNRHNPH